MTKTRRALICLVIYGLVGLGTFGRSAEQTQRRVDHLTETCGQQKDVYCPGLFDPPVLAGLLAGMLWPLYWSWELQAND